MANPIMGEDELRNKATKMAREGRNLTQISKDLGISWEEARGYIPVSTWQGAKAKITRQLNRLATEPDQVKRKKMACEADKYADFLYDAAKHLRGQVDNARKALNR